MTEVFQKIPEVKPLSPQQIEGISTLERIVVKDDHAEEFLGDTNSLDRKETSTKEMIKPSALRRFVKETAKENGVSPWEVVEQIRLLGVEDSEKSKIERKYKEVIGYASDVHGDPQGELLAKLQRMLQDPPEYLFFGGDIVGTKAFDELQRLFYNSLNNHSKNELLKDNPNASDEEILGYQGTKPPYPDFNLRKGLLSVREYELKLAGKTPEDIAEILEKMSDHEIAEEIRKYATYVHYGHYASNLPEDVKAGFVNGVEENARKYADIIKAFISKGTKVYAVQGNWDARIPIDFVPGTDAKNLTPLPVEDRLFNAKKYFEDCGIPFYDEIGFVDTQTTLQVLLPFDQIVNFPKLNDEERKRIRARVELAHSEGKSIIVVAHGEPNYQVHYLTDPKAEPKGEHLQLIQGFAQAIPLIRPDEIVHGHIHDLFVDEKKEGVDINSKYALKIDEKGNVKLVENSADIDKNNVVVSFIPWRRRAELKVSRREKQRKIAGFGGKRQPVKIVE